MPAKLISDRQKSARVVAGAATEHAGDVAEALLEILTPRLEEGETAPDLDLFFRLLGRQLRARSEELGQVDDAHTRELSQDEGLRRERDLVQERLYNNMIRFRIRASMLYGEGAARTLFKLGDQTFQEPTRLIRQAEQSINVLEDPDLRLPERLEDDVPFDPDQWAARLRPDAAALTQLMGDYNQDLQGTNATFQAKNFAMTKFDLEFGSCARALEAFYAMVGATDLADRVRPSRRRPGRVEDVDQLPPIEEPDPEPDPEPEDPPQDPPPIEPPPDDESEPPGI